MHADGRAAGRRVPRVAQRAWVATYAAQVVDNLAHPACGSLSSPSLDAGRGKLAADRMPQYSVQSQAVSYPEVGGGHAGKPTVKQLRVRARR